MRHFISFILLVCSCLLLVPVGLSQSIRVPGFQPGDGEKHHYFLMRFSKNGHLSSGAAVDENGLLYVPVVDAVFVNGEEVDWEHAYIYSQHHVSGENRYSFDLQDVPLLGFVQSLGVSHRRQPPPGTVVRGPASEGVLRAEVSDPLYEDKVVPHLQGENLTFAQTLDQLRDASGCDVIQVDDRLIIDWCG